MVASVVPRMAAHPSAPLVFGDAEVVPVFGMILSVRSLLVQLQERSPLRLLERGYAICYDAAGNVVQASDQVDLGDRIRIQLARGRFGAEVKDKE